MEWGRLFKIGIPILAVALLLSIPARAVFGQDADSGSGGSSTSSQPANLLVNVTAGTISEITLVDKGATSPDLSALAADGSGEDGMPADANGVKDWFVYTSAALGAPALQWDEHDTNTNAYYRVSNSAISGVSVNVQSATSTFTPNDWIFFKDDSSTSTPYYYGPRSFAVSLTAGTSTPNVIPPSGVTNTGEGSVTLRLLKYNGSAWSVVTETIALAFDNAADKLYPDDDLDMDEGTDTEVGLTKAEDDTSAAVGGDTYAQGDFLVKGSEIEVRGIQYVLETDLTGLSDSGTVTFTVGQFSGYDQSQSSTSMGIEIATLIPRLLPSGQALSFTLTVAALEHTNTP
jgi:hypothetical protein